MYQHWAKVLGYKDHKCGHGLCPHAPGGSDGKESVCNAENLGLTPGSGRYPGEGNGYPFQYPGLENHMGRGAWWATVHGVTQSWTRQK